MNLLIIDQDGCCLDIALRAQAWGHDVRLFIGPYKHDGSRNPTGDGLVKRVANWESSVNWADLIFLADNAKYLHNLEGLRNRGYPIFGANKETAQWELDRGLGQQIMQQAGIEIIPSRVFKRTQYKEARDYVVKAKRRLVSKPNGDVCKALSYVSKSAKDMCFMLDMWHKEGAMEDEFILQDFVPGVEFAVGGFFGPNGFSQYFIENFEHKKLMNDDKGENTGEMGTAIKYVSESKLAEDVLLPLTGALHRAGHTGYVDVSVIVDARGRPLPMEITARPGWPLDQIRLALEVYDPVQWMLDLIDGHDTHKPSTDVVVGVVMALPGFLDPAKSMKEGMGYPIYGITDSNLKHLHFMECKLGMAPGDNAACAPEEMLVSSGSHVCTITGTGKTVSQANKNAYKVVEEIEIPKSPEYRTDIGDRLEKDIPELQKHGYALDWRY